MTAKMWVEFGQIYFHPVSKGNCKRRKARSYSFKYNAHSQNRRYISTFRFTNFYVLALKTLKKSCYTKLHCSTISNEVAEQKSKSKI